MIKIVLWLNISSTNREKPSNKWNEINKNQNFKYIFLISYFYLILFRRLVYWNYFYLSLNI